jgi:hypothetical protein
LLKKFEYKWEIIMEIKTVVQIFLISIHYKKGFPHLLMDNMIAEVIQTLELWLAVKQGTEM